MKIFRGLIKYFAENGHKHGSRLVQSHYEVGKKHNVPSDDIALFEIDLSIALLANTASIAFWIIVAIFSNSSLLENLRNRLYALSTEKENPGEYRTSIRQLNIKHVMEYVPSVMSLLQEVFRVKSTNATGRVVLSDTLLEDRYLLKKGSFLLLPAAELHWSPSIWGATVDEFDPQRFMSDQQPGLPKVAPSALRGFGGGSAMCPGRYFASIEIISWVVLFVLRFNISPVCGDWHVAPGHPHIITSILSPSEDFEVSITEREEYKSQVWDFFLH